jgi:hypothetical protein
LTHAHRVAGPLHPITYRRDQRRVRDNSDFVFIKTPHPCPIKTRDAPFEFHPQLKTAASRAEAAAHPGSDIIEQGPTRRCSFVGNLDAGRGIAATASGASHHTLPKTIRI